MRLLVTYIPLKFSWLKCYGFQDTSQELCSTSLCQPVFQGKRERADREREDTGHKSLLGAIGLIGLHAYRVSRALVFQCAGNC